MDNLEYKQHEKIFEEKSTPALFKYKQSEIIDTSAAEVQARIDRKKVADQSEYEKSRIQQKRYEQSILHYINKHDSMDDGNLLDQSEDFEESQISKGRTR